MSTPILKTKLFTPRLRADAIVRPRLLEHLNDGLAAGHPLILVSSPAGYGKSTLLAGWLGQLETSRTAWLSLDAEDNDPLRFCTYLVAAIRTVDEDLCREAAALLDADSPPAPNRLSTLMLNDLAAVEDDLVVVLDDYHVIKSTQVHECVSFLLEKAPPTLHLVVATRIDPNLPLARLRARHQMTEVRAEDLAFSHEETAAFLAYVMDLEVSDEDASALARRTEGWIVGLQLAGLSLRGREDVHSFIESFSGGHQYIIDYLVDEVVAHLAPDRQRFLLFTSVLESFNAEICDAVLQRDDSRSVLEDLERSNLFIIPLDDTRDCFRYHHLFADLLRERLGRTYPGDVASLHERAALWYRDRRMWTDALGHAVKTDNVDLVFEVQTEVTHEAIRRGRMSALVYWGDAIPEKLVMRRPSLALMPMWTRVFVGDYEAAGRLAARLGARAAQLPEGAEKDFVNGDLALMQALAVEKTYDYDACLALLQEAESLMPDKMRLPSAVVQSLISNCYRASGALGKAEAYEIEATRRGEAIGDSWVVNVTIADRAGILRLRGDITGALALCQQTLRSVESVEGRRLGSCLRCESDAAESLRELNRLDDALGHARTAVRSLEGWGRAEDAVQIFAVLARVHLARAELREADEALAQAVAYDRAHEVHRWARLWRELAEPRVLLALGRDTEADAWADTIAGGPFAGTVPREMKLTESARVHLAHERADDALDILDGLLKAARRGKRFGNLILMQAIRAVALDENADTDNAFVALGEALAIGAREGHVRTFADLGEPMSQLLRLGLENAGWPGASADHARALIEAIEAGPAPAEDSSPRGARAREANDSLRDPLTQRELEVLPLVAEGMSNREIAKKILVSVNTVKTHIHNICAKLSVERRTQAAAKARDIGLI